MKQATKVILNVSHTKDISIHPCTKTELSSRTILVIGLVRNIAKDLRCLHFFITELRRLFRKVCFFYLTNNNRDHTVQLMRDWQSKDHNVYGMVIPDEKLEVLTPSGGIGNRVRKLAEYRNRLFIAAKMHFGTDFDYMLQIDTDLIARVTAEKFMTCFDLRESFDIICANGVFRASAYHYDVFALRLLGEPDDINVLYPKFKQHYGHSMDWITHMYKFTAWTRVKSAWGGMMLFAPHIFEQQTLYDTNRPLDECEHVSICRKFSRIFVNPKLVYMQDYMAEGQCYSSPFAFIPRDAGFFSVFNFLMGLLTKCGRVYPYFNFAQFFQTNKHVPRHFCYFNKALQNTWFDFFEPLTFFDADNNHVNLSQANIKHFKITQGETAPEEFRIPDKTKQLLEGPPKILQEWRNHTHAAFTAHINLAPKLRAHIDAQKSKLFTPGMPTLGVHYRHPSHCCEQGLILLSHYFDVVDKVLKSHPNADIYLATDTDFGLLAFQKRYGSKVKFIPEITRTSLDNLLEWAYARGFASTSDVGFVGNKGFELQHVSSRENVHGNPALAYDVLTDVFCLAECQWFVHTVSNLALAVSYINPSATMLPVKPPPQKN